MVFHANLPLKRQNIFVTPLFEIRLASTSNWDQAVEYVNQLTIATIE